MSGLQGQSTLSDDEKRTEAKTHLAYLADRLERLTQKEQDFVSQRLEAFETFGDRTAISNKQLFWLRDLVLKY